jgi:hypothetical protein
MSTVASGDGTPRVISVRVEGELISATLADGRVISIPLAWSSRLSRATEKQRGNYRIIGHGEGIHWPEVDEDISVEGMLFPAIARSNA